VTFERFNRNIVQRGDMLVLASDESTRLLFKFMSDSDVVATWLDEPNLPGRPDDVILLQKQVRRVVA
jgi:hypothetical protein